MLNRHIYKLAPEVICPCSSALGKDRLRSTGVAYRLRVASESPIEVPLDFVGLGYEMSSVATTGLLGTTNHRFSELVRGLGAKGVLRVGGIVADYTRYLPEGSVRNEPKNTMINRAN